MKMIARIWSIWIVFCISLQLIGGASAAEYANYQTNYISSEEQAEFLEKTEFTALCEPDEKPSIEWFAISDSGQIALGGHVSEDAVIYVYDTDGSFLYGYRFLNNHCALAIFFEGDNLAIYWAKSDHIGTFDSDGNCLQFRKVINTTANADAYHHDRYRPAKGSIGEIQYEAKAGIGLPSKYVRFTITDGEGNVRVIYDVETEHNIHFLGYVIVFSAALFIWVVGYLYGKKRNKLS